MNWTIITISIVALIIVLLIVTWPRQINQISIPSGQVNLPTTQPQQTNLGNLSWIANL
jgi:hypothetical protein